MAGVRACLHRLSREANTGRGGIRGGVAPERDVGEAGADGGERRREAQFYRRGDEPRIQGRAGWALAADPERLRLNDYVPARSQLSDRKSTRLNSSHSPISYAGFCL